MTIDELNQLLEDCPTLYHMAAAGSWPAIKASGLLSTTALLDLYEVACGTRKEIETRRRDTSQTLTHDGLPNAVVRDQLPIDDVGLRRALPDGMTPADWYQLLNGRVFFWFTKDRLLRLLGAAAYRSTPHDVFEVDSKALVSAYYDKIWLCPINSGCTKPFPHPRDKETFRRIPDYPYAEWKRKRKRGERVVELCVDQGVTDIFRYTTRAIQMRGADVVRVLYEA